MIVEISSFSNPRIKYLKYLGKSRNRKREGLFLMEGRPELDHALKSGLKPKLIGFCDTYISYEEIEALTGGSDCETIQLSKAVFDDLTYQNVPGNFLAVFESWDKSLESLNPDEFTIVLEGIEKPGNLGAIIRTCDALGVKQLVVSSSEIDLFNPNVLRNSRGGIFHTNVVFAENQEVLEFISGNSLNAFAAALSNKAKPIQEIKNSNVDVVIFGPESKGLSDFWLDQSIQHVIIPMNGIVDSLNLSVSVAIIASQLLSK